MTFKDEITLNQKDDITIMLLGSKKSIQDMENLRAFLKGFLAANPNNSFIKYHESNIGELVTYMNAFNKKLMVDEVKP